MTNEEAIERLQMILDGDMTLYMMNEKDAQAVHHAIKALEERTKGKWEYTRNGIIYCNLCNHNLGFKGNFCPNCGADMKGDEA